MVKYILWVFSSLLLFINADCKKNPVSPIDDLKPGRRDYVWTVDTISSPPNLFYLFSLWGSNPENIWAVGSADETVNALWHYNGIIWEKTTQRLSSNLQSIYGFDSSEIWMCDSPGGNIFRFDGSAWAKFTEFSVNGFPLTYINNIWGDNSHNIYAAGAIADGSVNYKGIILKFDGNIWKSVPIPETRISFIWIRRGMKESDKYYLTATRFESVGDTNKIYEFDGLNLKEIYTGQEVATVNEMAGRIYICIGKKIFKYQNNQLAVWKDFSATQHVGRVWGRSEKDFFTVGENGLTHYNGTDLITIYATEMFINDAFIFEKDIFILCNNRIIIHGKLQ